MVDSKYYMCVLAQCFSPSGELLVAGNNFGKLAVFNVNSLLPQDNGIEKKGWSLDGHKRTIQCMNRTESHLLTAATEIHGWSWNNLQTRKNSPDFIINIPVHEYSFDKAEINALCVDEENSRLYAGCGDHSVHVFDLQTAKVISTFSEHQDAVLSMSLKDGLCLSGSEDGSIRFWDPRLKKQIYMIEPFKNTKVDRPHLGKWIGCVDTADDWLVCGGGPRLSLWHFRSMSLSNVLPPDDAALNWVKFHEDRIITGGSRPALYQIAMSGDLLTQIPTASEDIYSMALQESPVQLMSIGGSSYYLDICTTLNYKDYQVCFPD